MADETPPLAPTPLPTDLDFDADGKQVGTLRIPYSVNRSAYGWQPAPLACIRNGDGPTVLLMSGVHGDGAEARVECVTVNKWVGGGDDEC